MAASSTSLLILCLFVSGAIISGNAGGDHALIWVPTTAAGGRKCRGSVAECLAGEFDMDSEINRRILATTQYISYSALQRNSVPCSQRGASYYNCQPGAEANPYSRGCSAITRCRS